MQYKKSKSAKKMYLLIIICVVLVYIFKNEVNAVGQFFGNVFLGIKSSAYKMTTDIKTGINNAMYYKSYIEENKQIRIELYKLKLDKIKMNELEAENERLRNLLRLKDEKKYDFIVAGVSFRDPLTLFEYIYLDKGSRDGIQKGMVVLNKDMLLGKIEEVHENTSKVAIITKKDMFVSVVTESGNLGVLSGDNNSRFKLEYVIADNVVKDGELVMTSGISNVYPRGLLLGRIKKNKIAKNNLFKDIEVEPLYNVIYLEEVLVLK